MRTDRSRINASTQLLLDIERQLLDADQAGIKEDLPTLFRKLYSDISSYRRIRTSREVDEFLQLFMVYIAARLHFDFRNAKDSEFKISISVYDAKHELFVIKPSYFFPGSCSIRYTTILLTSGEEEGWPNEARPGGLSSLALASGEVLHCTRLQEREPCPHYIPLESRSSSALSVPLRLELAGALDRFQRAKIPPSGPGPHCCDCRENVHAFPQSTNGYPSYGVLNIDCSTGELQIEKAKQILGDCEIQAVLNVIVDRLAGYQADRAAYSVLRNCTALVELSQHKLREARQIYVILLREISAICDGADVTLHLRDMFAKEDRNRSVKIIAGFGPRFRGFLIGERYGDGLVGEAMVEPGQFKSRDREEIASAFTGKHDYSYRRLMPGTALNAALPIRFHSRVIGAINIEWDNRQVSGMSAEEADRYLSSKQAALERLAQYFALVIDYFDDQENKILKPPDDHARHWVRKSISRRRVLAYYVNSALQRINTVGEGGERPEQLSQRLYLEHILRDIIDAVGYFLTFENKHRILASVRHRGEGDNLDLVYAHGFNPKDGEELGPGGPIPIVAGQSVLGTCAKLGVAVFGRVENGQFLRPDRLCKDCAPKEDQEVLSQPIIYKAAGHHPVYEVGVPLVFGGEILGTLDFELFSLTRNSPERGTSGENGDLLPTLAGHELTPFLEWARAITFCMAYAEDALQSELAMAELDSGERGVFRRFQWLCAYIVANVAIPQHLLTSIAGEYLRGLIPLREPEFLPATGDDGTEPASSVTLFHKLASNDSRELELWRRGERLGAVRISLDAETVPLHSVFPETNLSSGTSILAQRFIFTCYTAALSAEREGEFDSSEFKRALGSVQSAFSEEVETLKRNAEKLERLDPYALIDTCFSLLHQALQRLLPAEDGGLTVRHTGRHGWFLYMAQCIEDPDLGERAVLRSGKPFARWVSMSTLEMKTLVSRVLESQDPEKTLGDILGPAVAEEILLAAPQAAELSVERLEELFLEALGRRGRDYPDPRRDQEPSLTAVTVLQKRVRSDIDLNQSPMRSERKSKWFFGDKAYSIIGVPILLGKRVIGILQIFRRRDAIDDVLFFKNDEIEAVAQIGKMLEVAIAAEVECLPVPVLSDTAVEASFTREVIALGDRLKERISKRQVLLLVSCDFLAETASYERFLNCYVGPNCTSFTTHELLKLKTVELERMDHLSPVCVLYTREKPGTRLCERLAALTSAPAVILFVSHGEERTTFGLLPGAFFERQEPDDPAEVLRVAFGLAEGRESHDREEIGILLRKSGMWTIERLLEDCGKEAGVIHNSAKIILKDLKERPHVARRLFPDWYQNVEEAGLTPSRTSYVRRS